VVRSFLLRLLRRWADQVSVGLIADLRHEIASLKSQLAIEKSENERLALKHARWCEMEKAEAAIHVNRRVIAEGSAMRTE
jgi:hypothetical protein